MYGIFQKHQAQHLVQDHEVGVLSPLGRSLRFLPAYFRNAKVTRPGDSQIRTCKNVIWNVFPKFKRLEWLWYKWAGLFLYQVYLYKYGKPDVIHAHNTFHAGRFAVNLKRTYGIPLVLTEHSSVFLTKQFNHREELIIDTVFSFSDQIIAVSTSIAERLRKFQKAGPKKVEVVFNVLDEDFEKEAHVPRALLPENHRFTFFNLAGLTDIKNHRLLIESFSKFAPGRSVVLKIGGDGPLFSELQNLIISLGMQSQIFLLGHLERDEVKDVFRKSNCFVLSSNHETFGVVLIEALCFGVPLLSTRCGGPDEIVTNENGVLIDVGCEDQFIDGFQRMVKCEQQYEPGYLKQECLRLFSGEAFLKKIDPIYQQVLRKK